MKLTIFSKHIPIKAIVNVASLMSDIRLFNKGVHKAVAMKSCKIRTGPSERAKVSDMRRTENKHLREQISPSDHVALKTYLELGKGATPFVNSAEQQASAIIKSCKELVGFNIAEKKAILSSVQERLSKENSRLSELEKTKASLVEISRYEKRKKKEPLSETIRKPSLKMPKGGTEVFDKESGTFIIRKPKLGTDFKEWSIIKSFSNSYLFEVQYLNPLIKKKRALIRNLQNRIEKISKEISRLEEKNYFTGICLGTKRLFRAQVTKYASEPHDVWTVAFDKARNHSMMISGRHDAKGGNFMFKYDPLTKRLVYTALDGKKVEIPAVFPYGQEYVDKAVVAPSDTRKPVAWRVDVMGGSLVVKCIVEVVPERINNCYINGCVGMDMNVDNVSFTETDSCGNLLYHNTVHFDLTGLSSGHAKQILSSALEVVFKHCYLVCKPLVIEDLTKVDNTKEYGSKKLNRKLSGFAYRVITDFAMSKERKYEIGVLKVNPAYTSAMGKTRYMKKYGLSTHEAASYCIARRGMGFGEKVPASLREKGIIPISKLSKHQWSQWSSIYKEIRMVKPSICYGVGMGSGIIENVRQKQTMKKPKRAS